MNTLWSLVIKFALTFVAAWISFALLSEATLGWIILVALVGTALNYIIGDLAVLPRFGNMVASIGDGVLAALAAWILGELVAGIQATTAALITFAILVAVAEYFFHRYLLSTSALPNVNRE